MRNDRTQCIEWQSKSRKRTHPQVLRQACLFIVLSLAGCMRLASTPVASTPIPSTQRVAKRAFLVHGQPEDPGYGVYNYVLFGRPPADAMQADRYLRLIQGYLAITQLSGTQGYVQPWHVALTYMPVMAPPPFDVTGATPGYISDANSRSMAAQWILEHYDYDRAQHILLLLQSDQFTGPYLVTYAKPLTGLTGRPERFLFQDMSNIELSVVGLWIRTFLEQSAQERFWEQYALQTWALDLRNAIAAAAAIAPQFRRAFDQLIVFVELFPK